MASNLAKVGWMKDAACRDAPPKLFSSFDIKDIKAAKAICASCPVRLPCLISYWETSAVVAGTTKLERLEAMWKRKEAEGDSNWRGPDCLFEAEGKRK